MTDELEGKTCLVTGASAGLGRATAGGLAKAGATVILVCRNQIRGAPAREEVVAESTNQSIELMIADLSSLSSVRQLATDFTAKHSKLDVLVNNAAIFTRRRVITPEGFESMFAANYLGSFLLTRLLLPSLQAAQPARIINVTAPSTTEPNFDDLQYERKFGAIGAFGASKAENLLFTYALARRLEGQRVTVNAYHPGIMRTNLMNDAPAAMRILTGLMKLFVGKPPEHAAEGLVQLASESQFDSFNGKLIHDGKAIKAPFAEDTDTQERLWQISSRLVGLTDHL